MIITEEDVGRQVLMTNGDIRTIEKFQDDYIYGVVLDDKRTYTETGKLYLDSTDYSDCESESDVQGFITDVEETYDESGRVKELNEYFESNDKDIKFTIPNNCVNMSLEIGEYEIKVQRRFK